MATCSHAGLSPKREAGKSNAYGFLQLDLAGDDRRLEIEILGEMIPVRIYSKPLLDPENEYLQGVELASPLGIVVIELIREFPMILN